MARLPPIELEKVAFHDMPRKTPAVTCYVAKPKPTWNRQAARSFTGDRNSAERRNQSFVRFERSIDRLAGEQKQLADHQFTAGARPGQEPAGLEFATLELNKH